MNDAKNWTKVEPVPDPGPNPGPPSDHEHLWEPTPNWSGRYRCSVCQGLGYRALVTADKLDDRDKKGETTWVPRGYSTSQIVPYLCKKKGCSKAATSYGRKGQFCKDHAK